MENIFTTFWNKNKIILKSFWIGLLILLLLIPTLFIQDLVHEREGRREEAVTEISSKWARAQTITGPVIGIPYTETVMEGDKAKTIKKWSYFLPNKLSVDAHLIPETRYRGIYQVVVYTTELDIRGYYDSLHLDELNIPKDHLLWSEAAVFFDVSDVQGLKEELTLHLGTSNLDMVPAKVSTEQFKDALSAALPPPLISTPGRLDFSAKVRLKGSGSLAFVPVGKETTVGASSTWSNPSFMGTFLPDVRTVRDSGFAASWHVLYLNRKFPQQWKDARFSLEDAAFGVNLIVPVDPYQQTTRSVKYAILVILLTFTAFFLIEWIYQRPIHSLQYVLVGFALCLFYTLLLSLSEYIGFNAAYATAAVATIVLIAWYVGSMLRSTRMSLVVALLLVVQYGFIFTLIQLQDYALLMGSIGLFLTLAIVMYFSRKIKWN